MTDIDGRWPLLEEAQEDEVTVISDHPNLTGLAIACGPFFRWMHDHDHASPHITFNPDGSLTIAGTTIPAA
jgi:hypothetical protein